MKKINQIEVPYIAQIGSDTCWLASINMILKYYKGNNFQYCFYTNSQKESEQYAKENNKTDENISSILCDYMLFNESWFKFDHNNDEIKARIISEIDQKRPIIAGTMLNGGHAVVICGYEINEKDEINFIIDDPFEENNHRINSDQGNIQMLYFTSP